MMIWNTRAVRVTVGLLLLAAGVVALLPTLTGYTSLDGTVNAPIGIISAPIEGVVTNNPPKIGTFIPAGDDLLGIRNDRIVRTAEAQIEADLTAAKQRLQALREQISKLTELNKELQSRLQEFQQASIRNVTQEIAVRQHRISTAAAQQKSADADLVRKQTLGTTGIVAGSSVEQARAASVTAQNEGNIAREELERLNQQLDALKRGVFVGEGRNDVPYSQQRMDEVTIQLAEVQFRARDLEARIVQLDAQLEQERTRNRTLRYAMVRMPFDGVIWRTNVVEGSNVIAGVELAQALDCQDLFVDILVSRWPTTRSIPAARPRFASSAAPRHFRAEWSRYAAARPPWTTRCSRPSLRRPAARMRASGSVSRGPPFKATTRTSARLGARCRSGSRAAPFRSNTGSMRYGSALPRGARAIAADRGDVLPVRAQLAAP
jgi:multidrug resistance efflux pump